MTRSIRGSRRAALLLAGVAGATSLLASGCGAGQVSETSVKQPSVQGVNAQTPDGAYKVRGLYVEYPGADGYKAGSDAAVNAVIYNDTKNPVTVTVTTDSAREIVLTGSTGSASPSASASESASPSGSPSASESASASPSASESTPAGEPAKFEISAFGYLQLNVQGGRHLQLVGLNDQLRAGQQVNLVFDFGNGVTINTSAPIGVPLSPGAVASPIITREGGAEGGGQGNTGHGG